MKIDRHGRAKILSVAEIQLLFSQGLQNGRDRALFGICLYTACRINEACTLRTADVYDRREQVRTELIIRKENTKGKLATRSIPVIEELRSLLVNYYPSPRTWFLFTGRHGRGHINPDSAARILRESCARVGIEGVSTHSFRRTALTQMSNAGIPLRIIQEVSGHRNLSELQKYLEVTTEQVRGAVSSLSMLSHVGISKQAVATELWKSFKNRGISLYSSLDIEHSFSNPDYFDSRLYIEGKQDLDIFAVFPSGVSFKILVSSSLANARITFNESNETLRYAYDAKKRGKIKPEPIKEILSSEKWLLANRPQIVKQPSTKIFIFVGASIAAHKNYLYEYCGGQKFLRAWRDGQPVYVVTTKEDVCTLIETKLNS